MPADTKVLTFTESTPELVYSKVKDEKVKKEIKSETKEEDKENDATDCNSQ